jgi:hypothetical protein
MDRRVRCDISLNRTIALLVRKLGIVFSSTPIDSLNSKGDASSRLVEEQLA